MGKKFPQCAEHSIKIGTIGGHGFGERQGMWNFLNLGLWAAAVGELSPWTESRQLSRRSQLPGE
jgi:hypothetical protein